MLGAYRVVGFCCVCSWLAVTSTIICCVSWTVKTNFSITCISVTCVSPWYDLHGWLAVKYQEPKHFPPFIFFLKYISFISTWCVRKKVCLPSPVALWPPGASWPCISCAADGQTWCTCTFCLPPLQPLRSSHRSLVWGIAPWASRRGLWLRRAKLSSLVLSWGLQGLPLEVQCYRSKRNK